MHCHPLSVSVAVVLALVFTIGLAETACADWTHGEKFLLAPSTPFGQDAKLLFIVTDVVYLPGPRDFIL
jgi:hypothetical protein